VKTNIGKTSRPFKTFLKLKINTAVTITAVFICLAILLATHATPAMALELPEPSTTGFVNDYAGMLSEQTVTGLEGKLREYEQSSSNEITVVTVDDLQGTTIEDYAVRLFEKWKIGKESSDNGILLLVAKSEHKVRIEVGYGLEGSVTDAESSSIIRDVITPAFKQSDFDKGVSDGVDTIIKAASTEYAGQGGAGSGGGESSPWSALKDLGSLVLPAIFILFGLVQWLMSILARTKSWWLGGAIGAVFGILLALFASVIVGVIAMALLTPLGFLLDFMVSRAYTNSLVEGAKGIKQADAKHGGKGSNLNDGGSIPWWAGGYWGPGGFGGSGGGDSDGGFGDFGGFGGGDSGGGGASGDW
jgi:uncharacterized protein